MVADAVQVRSHQRCDVHLGVRKVPPAPESKVLEIAIVLYRFPHHDELPLNQIGGSVAGRILDELALGYDSQHCSMAKWNQKSFQHHLDVVVPSHRCLVAPFLEIEFPLRWIPTPVRVEP